MTAPMTSSVPTAGAPLLEIDDLRVAFGGRGWRARPTEVLHGISLHVRAGETLGLVGESGSGKTTVGRAVLGLAPVTGGSIRLDGEERAARPAGRPGRRRQAGADVQVVFQDPYSSLNPAMTIEQILTEPLAAQGVHGARERVRTLLDRVGLPADAGSRLAREFSGGQRQRIAIARALALEPKLIICDEPTSALDLSTQATVLDLFIQLQQDTGCAYLFITHDLAVVRRMSHRIAVMHAGEIVETGTAEQVSDHPNHPYTQRLQMAAPVADPARQRRRRAERAELLRRQGAAAS